MDEQPQIVVLIIFILLWIVKVLHPHVQALFKLLVKVFIMDDLELQMEYIG